MASKEWWDRHPAERKRVSDRRRAWFIAHPEAIERLREGGRQSYARQVERLRAAHPWREPLYDALKAEHPGPEPCDRCGGDGRMMLRFDNEAQTVALLGWRCYPCRKMAGKA